MLFYTRHVHIYQASRLWFVDHGAGTAFEYALIMVLTGVCVAVFILSVSIYYGFKFVGGLMNNWSDLFISETVRTEK
jgi:Flp pilus assembly pilin Flp